MSKITGFLLGHVIGDAMGTPVENLSREYLQSNKVTEMLGGINSQHKEPVGSWSDDTSMELALIDSIINTKIIDYDDIMNNFVSWIDDGKSQYNLKEVVIVNINYVEKLYNVMDLIK